MRVRKPGLEWYVNKLKDDEPFSFIRYGNGEWDCILDTYHETRSGSQRFTKGLRASLAASLLQNRDGGCFYASQSTSYLKRVGLLPKADQWLIRNNVSINWHDGEVFHKASYKGKINPLIRALRGKKVVVVGPPWLITLPLKQSFVPVSPKNCWQEADEIFKRLLKFQDHVISFSAGPTAKVLIHRLYPMIGDRSWLIDFGSLWDPYVGKKTRKYHERMKPKLVARNLR